MTREPDLQLLLEYLYGLFDSSDPAELAQKSEIERLLAASPAWQAALAKVKKQQQRLASAARLAIGDFAFTPPEVVPSGSTSGKVLKPAAAPGKTARPSFDVTDGSPSNRPIAGPGRRRAFGWRWVAVAMSIALVTLGGWYWQAVVAHEKRLAQLQETVALVQTQQAALAEQERQAAAAVAAAEQEIQRLDQIIQQRSQAVLREKARDFFFVQITRPAHVEPGAPYAFHLEARDLNDQPVQPKLRLQIVDEQQRIVVPPEQVVWHQPRPGDFLASLPPSLVVASDVNWSVEVTAELPGSAPQTFRDRFQLFRSRYLTHVTTDKPLYQPGETVYFRTLTLERATLRPPQEELTLDFSITNGRGEQVFQQSGRAQVKSAADGEILKGPDQLPLQGLGAGVFVLPPDAPGGEYILTVSERHQRFPPEQRRFLVQQYEKPRLRKELEFTRKSFGPGDEVVAFCQVTAAEGGRPIAKQPVSVTFYLDGAMLDAEGQSTNSPWQLRTDDAGHVLVRLRLPKAIHRGDATLSVRFTDGAAQETLVRPVPVVVNKCFIDLFPEGGDLVAGVPNRVYFTARTPLDKPAELRARLVDQDRRTVAELETFHDDRQPGANQGMGQFVFTPRADSRYFLLVEKPERVEPVVTIPEVKRNGVVLRAPSPAPRSTEPWRFELVSVGADRRLLVGLYCRGLLVGQQRLLAKSGQWQSVEISPSTTVGGVHRVAVFEELDGGVEAPASFPVRLRPVAERLVYRAPERKVQLRLSTQRPEFLPGEKAQLTISAATETGEPASAILMLSVVDKNVLTLADEKTARAMPTHFLLTHELRKPEDLEHSDFLLSEHSQALTALDLMLGTQGWRRFAEQDPRQFRAQHGPEAERLLQVQGQLPVVQSNRQSQFQRLMHSLEAAVDQELQALQIQRQAAAQRRQAAEKNRSQAPWNEQARQNDWEMDRLLAQLAELHKKWSEFKTRFTWLAATVVLMSGLIGSLIPLGRKTVQWLTSEERKIPAWLGLTALVIIGVILITSLGLLVLQVGGKKDVAAAALVFDPEKIGVAVAARERDKGLTAGATPPPPLAPPAPMAAPPPGVTIEERANAEHKPPLVAAPPQTDTNNWMLPHAAMAFGPPRRPAPPVKQDFESRLPGPEHQRRAISKATPTQTSALSAFPAPLTDRKELGQSGSAKPLAPTSRAEGQGSGKSERSDQRDGNVTEVDAIPPASSGAPAGQAGRRLPGGGPDRGGDELSRLTDPSPDRSTSPGVFIVREYAHRRSGPSSQLRTDFTETVYWHPVLLLTDGQGRVSFDLSDSITTYQVTAYAHTFDGRLGAASMEFAARLPFHLEPKLPAEVTASDIIDAPISLVNRVDAPNRLALQTQAHGLTSDSPPQQIVELGPQAQRRAVIRLRPTVTEGPAGVRISGRLDSGLSDGLERSLRVVPDGFPIVNHFSGTLDGSLDLDLILPERWLPGTLTLQAAVYPTVMADLLAGLDGLLREPLGCFEQASSSNYPNLLILNYLQETRHARPEIARRARDFLAAGYEKLLAFECRTRQQQRRGYEWFGGFAPPHEALTAYGLMQFHDMKKFVPVDEAMLERTRQFLLERRDGRGGFLQNPKALDTFGRAPPLITNAYILWALSSTDTAADLTAELTALLAEAIRSNDPYFLALTANCALNLKRPADAAPLLRRMAALQHYDGRLNGTTTSITGSAGKSLDIETTALALLAWLKANDTTWYESSVKAMRWLVAQRDGYGAFGATQATILALKALIAYSQQHRRDPKGGDLVLTLGQQEAARVRFGVDQTEPVEVRLPADHLLKPGRNVLRLTLTGNNVFPYSLRCSYRTLQPASAEECAIRVAASLDRHQLREGDTVRLTVKVRNVTEKGHGMSVAIIGLPAGLSLPEDAKQLRDYTRLLDDETRPGRIAAWEIIGRELVLYWRDLAPRAEIEVPIDLIARVPGQYRGPASRAYLYYQPEHKHWQTPLSVTIVPAP